MRGSAVVAALGFAAGIASGAAIVWGGYTVPADLLGPTVVLHVAVGWSFVGIGLLAHRRRPRSRSGTLMCLVGFAWLLRAAGAVEAPAPFVVGVLTKSLYFGVLVHLLVTFPTGRTTTTWQRLLIGLGYLITTPVAALYLALSAAAGGCWDCPLNVVVIQTPPPSATAVDDSVIVVVLLGAALFVVLLGLLLRRWQRAGVARRRELGPAVWGGAAILATTVVQYMASVLGAPPSVQETLAWSTEAVLVVWPAALLLGLARSRLDRAAAGPIVLGPAEVAATPEQVRAAVAAALHDPDAVLAFWIPERAVFVDGQGEPVTPDPPGEGQTCTPIEHDGELVAVVTHSCPDSELVAAVATSAGLAVRNQRLHAAARARLAELRASRRRIVEAADSERRRLERDLHDGAQQRLLSVALAVRLARTSPTDSDELIREAGAELDRGIDELRLLAQGAYPAALAEAGLSGALRELADRAPAPVRLTGQPVGRLPANVEHACWFTVSELVANAAKHAAAAQVVVDLRAVGDDVVLRVSDDGAGGADPEGSGLRGLTDRVEAAGGVFTVHSPPGAGTTATAVFPSISRVLPAAGPVRVARARRPGHRASRR